MLAKQLRNFLGKLRTIGRNTHDKQHQNSQKMGNRGQNSKYKTRTSGVRTTLAANINAQRLEGRTSKRNSCLHPSRCLLPGDAQASIFLSINISGRLHSVDCARTTSTSFLKPSPAFYSVAKYRKRKTSFELRSIDSAC